jgi:hypothetical protein
VLPWVMSLAYRIVFECPNGYNINLQKKCGNVSLSETEAMKLFGDEEAVLCVCQLRLARESVQNETPSNPTF